MTRKTSISIAITLMGILTSACAIPTGGTGPDTTAVQDNTTSSSDTTTSPSTPKTVNLRASSDNDASAPTTTSTVLDVTPVHGSCLNVVDLGAKLPVTNEAYESYVFGDCVGTMTGTYTFTYTSVGASPEKGNESIVLNGGQRSDLSPFASPTVTDVACKLQQVLTTDGGAGTITSVLETQEDPTDTYAVCVTDASGAGSILTGTYADETGSWNVTATRTSVPANIR